MQNPLNMTSFTPYSSPALNRIYDMLFCDIPEVYAYNEPAAHQYPWNLLSGTASEEELMKVYRDRQLETRIRLLASRLLMKAGAKPVQKDLLGVIVEVGLEQGLDVLAAYQDGTARYINYSGSMIIWESRNNSSDQLIKNLFTVSEAVVRQIGPWEADRLQPPGPGAARINFLVSDGLYFGQAALAQLTSDPLAGPVMDAATTLMIYLTETSRSSSTNT